MLHNIQEIEDMYISKKNKAIYLMGKKMCSNEENYSLILETIKVYDDNIRFYNSSQPEIQLVMRVNLQTKDEYDIKKDITNSVFLNFKIVQEKGIKFLCIMHRQDKLLISEFSLRIFTSRLRKYNCEKKNYYVFEDISNQMHNNIFLRMIGELEYV